MDAIYAPPLAQRRSSTSALRIAVAAFGSFVAEVLVAGARGHDFERTFSSAPGAQFSALPTSSKQRFLDRGLRP
ncbi:MAG: hypothetical protein R6W48_05865 [Gaiellaceae bacterium]